jgi:hypothetical protein
VIATPGLLLLQKNMHMFFATTFVCVIANADGYFMIAKKGFNSVCLQTILRV